ncbi:hypothetical protein [Streptomyces sp. NPDC051211]|uniref:hypothetical protein n=1 Tax=Streptomyces sp. NPDC051211 TaxID=3154643 RepID=UPI00344CDF6B
MLLTAPLLASSVALTPAFAAQGRTAEAGAASARGPAPLCELVPHRTGQPGQASGYDLLLRGFAPNQSVRVEGPKTALRTTVDDQGQLERQNVRYGTYSVSYKEEGAQKDKRLRCSAPPRKQDGGKQKIKVTKVEVLTIDKPATPVDCTKPQKVAFDGKITAVGHGKVPYYWTFASSAEPFATGSVTFEPGTTGHSILKVVEVPGTTNPTTSLDVFMTLHVPDHELSARSEQVKLPCAKKQ